MKHDNDSPFKKLLALKNITATQLAIDSGINSSTLYRYLKGENSPTIAQAKAIADSLGVSLDFFYDILEKSIEHYKSKE